MSSSGKFKISINSAAIFCPPVCDSNWFRLFAGGFLTLALAVFFPGGDAGFDGAHVAVPAVAGTADSADDDVVDDERKSAGYQNDLSFHQAERAVKTLRVGLQLIGGFSGRLLQRHRPHRLAYGKLHPEARGAVHGIERNQIAVKIDHGDRGASVIGLHYRFGRLDEDARLVQWQRRWHPNRRTRSAIRGGGRRFFLAPGAAS